MSGSKPGWFFPVNLCESLSSAMASHFNASTSDSFTVSQFQPHLEVGRTQTAGSQSRPHIPVRLHMDICTRLNDLYLCLSLRLSLLRVYHIESYLSMLSPWCHGAVSIQCIQVYLIKHPSSPNIVLMVFHAHFENQASNAIKPYGQSISCRSPLCPLKPSIISERPGFVRKQQKTWENSQHNNATKNLPRH